LGGNDAAEEKYREKARPILSLRRQQQLSVASQCFARDRNFFVTSVDPRSARQNKVGRPGFPSNAESAMDMDCPVEHAVSRHRREAHLTKGVVRYTW